MKEIKFRLLKADEIECRVGTEDKSANKSWCTLLLYKDARVDMRMLDETVGALNWQREHSIRQNIINGVQTMCNYCKVSIFNDETSQWVSKEDIGTESNTENAKGECSDAFKRACFNWGIGRELYSAPTIFINLNQNDVKNGRIKQTFSVKSIGYDDNGNINFLVIVDSQGNERYTKGARQQDVNYSRMIDGLVAMAMACKTKDELVSLKNSNPAYVQDPRFRDALNSRYSQISSAA